MLDGVKTFLLSPSLMMLMWLGGCVVVVHFALVGFS
jgi:hypothetical protein